MCPFGDGSWRRVKVACVSVSVFDQDEKIDPVGQNGGLTNARSRRATESNLLAGISPSRKISFHIWSLAAFSRMGESSDIKFEAMIK